MADYWKKNKENFVDVRKMPKTRVAIVGMGSTRNLCPYNERDLEVWGVNEGYVNMKRYDKWFQLHKREVWENNEKDPNHLAVLKAMECPIYMQTTHEDIPNSVAYPLNEMIEKYGEVFGGTIAYMFALALEQGFRTIELYGVELSKHTEYAHQKPSLFYFMGIAKERGIKVVIPEESKLDMKILYGYQHEDIAKVDDNISKIKLMRKEIINYTCDISKMEGFLLAIKEYKAGKLDMDAIETETLQTIQQYSDARQKLMQEKDLLSKDTEKRTGHPITETAPDVKVY